MRNRFFAIGVALVCLAKPSHATIITSSTDLGLSSIVTFEELVFPDGTPLSSEFAPYGITFGPGVNYDPNGPSAFPGFAGHHVGNFFPVTDPWSVFLNDPATAASFALATNPNLTTIEAFLGGTLVESATFSTTFDNAGTAFIQVAGITFDEIRLSTSGDGLAIIDNVEFAPVPEPGAALLLGTGLVAVYSLRRRFS